MFGIFAALASRLAQGSWAQGRQEVRAVEGPRCGWPKPRWAHRDTSVSALCRELGITPVTLYRYVGPQGELREQGQKVLDS